MTEEPPHPSSITLPGGPEQAPLDLARSHEGVFRLTADGVIVQDENGRITYANPAAAEMMGCTAEQVVGRQWSQLAKSERRGPVQQAPEVQVGGETDRYELQVECAGGSCKFVQVTNVPRFDKSGRYLGGLAVLHDVTGLKRAEAALRQGEENFRAIAENINDGVLIAASDGSILYVNRRAVEITGYSAAELLDIRMRDLARPDHVPQLASRLRRRLAGQPVPNQYEVEIGRKDGETVTVEVSAAATTWYGQTADLVSIRDVSKRRETERALRESEERLRILNATLTSQVEHRAAELVQAATRLEQIRSIGEQVNAAPALEQKLEAVVKGCVERLDFRFSVVVCCDDQRRVLSRAVLHPADERLPKIRQLIGVDLSNLSWPYRPGVNPAFDEVMGGRAWQGHSLVDLLCPPLSPESVEAVSELHGGTTFLVFPLPTDSEVIGLLYLVTHRPEISPQEFHMLELLAHQVAGALERARYLERLHARTAELESTLNELQAAQDQLIRSERLAAVGELAAGVAHDLRNPLAVIHSSALIMENRLPREDPTLCATLERLQRAVQASDRLVSDLLVYAQARPPDWGWENLNALVQQTLEAIPTPPGVEVHICLADDLPSIRLDAQQVVRAVRNLVENAIQAMPRGGDLTVHTWMDPGIDPSGRSVFLSISDTGEGIPPEVRSRIFEPLYTTRAQGMGLGLPICRRIVARHGGVVDVESNPDQGTTFTVRLPAGAQDER